MLTLLARNWWLVTLRGVIAILFGIIILAAPGMALASLILLFGAYAVVDGIAAVWSAVQNRTQEGWWIHLLEGFVSILAGIVAFMYPDTTTVILLYVIAVWAIMTGVFEILAAIRLRKEIEGEFWLGLMGLLSVIFGVFLILRPGEGILTVLSIVSIYAIVFGVFLIMLSLKLRDWSKKIPTRTPA